jgi:transcriptional antiterminator RfaH
MSSVKSSCIEPTMTTPLPATKARWYLLRCKPRQDERALQNLARQGFTCYGPARTVERLRNGHRFIAREALFPGYVFIHLDCVNDSWSSIRSTRGVLQIVRFNEYPIPVRDQIIEGIRARLRTAAAPEPYLQPGQRVRIVDGPFAQLEAVFLASDGEERVMLLLKVLQHDQTLSFPLHAVRKLGSGPGSRFA